MSEVRFPLKGKAIDAEIVFDTDDIEDLEVNTHRGFDTSNDGKFFIRTLNGENTLTLRIKFKPHKHEMFEEKKTTGFEGITDEVPGQPQHGDSGTCTVCGGEIEYYKDSVYTAGGEESVLTTWWAHRVHPADGHDAVLGGPA